MSRFEYLPKINEKYPFTMDLEGIPRDRATREAKLAQERMMANRFLADTVFDLNNPPKDPYIHQSFPKTVYHHGNGGVKIVQSAEELSAAEKEGWKLKASSKYDYSRVRNGKAPRQMTEEEQDIYLNGPTGSNSRFLDRNQRVQAEAAE